MPDGANAAGAAAGAMGTPMRFLICAALLAGFFLAGRLFCHLLGPRLAGLAQRRERPYLSAAVHGFLKPGAAFLTLLGLYIGARLLPFPFADEPAYRGALERLMRLAVIVLGAWGGLNIFPFLPHTIFGSESRLTQGLGAAMARFLERLCKAVIVFFALVLFINELGFNISSLITGLGLGGLTVALAAQDTAANFFGGLVILFERPFGIGDWISTASVEGTVEDITFRSTKIRTIGNAPTLIPNSKLCAEPITNWSRLQMRLSKFTLSLSYSTSRATMERVVGDVRAMLETHPDVHADTVQVRFLEFSESSLDIFVFFYVKTASIVEYRAVQEDINLRIMDIVAADGASFAFPTRSIFLETKPPAAESESVPGQKGAPRV